MKLYVDMERVSSKFNDAWQWDRKHREECGWNERDVDMIAEGLNQAREVLCSIFYEDLSKGE